MNDKNLSYARKNDVGRESRSAEIAIEVRVTWGRTKTVVVASNGNGGRVGSEGFGC